MSGGLVYTLHSFAMMLNHFFGVVHDVYCYRLNGGQLKLPPCGGSLSTSLGYSHIWTDSMILIWGDKYFAIV